MLRFLTPIGYDPITATTVVVEVTHDWSFPLFIVGGFLGAFVWYLLNKEW